MKGLGVNIVENPNYQNAGQLSSLAKSLDKMKGDTIIFFGDILFKKYILNLLVDDEEDIVIIVDSLISRKTAGKKSDFVYSSVKSDHLPFDNPVYLKKMEFAEPKAEFDGEWIGMLKLSEKGAKTLTAFIKEHLDSPTFAEMQIPDMLNALVEKGHKIKIQYIHGHWLDVDDVLDLNLATNF
jgi:phosphoenolpyruvate phosphomutase